MYLQAVRSLAQYSLALVRAGTSGDLETLNKVKATKGSIEELYAKVNEIINRFDFVKDLPLAIDIEKGYPTGWDKQKVLDTCMGEFKKLGLKNIKSLYRECNDNEKVLIDVKGIFDIKELKSSGIQWWRL